MKRNLLLIAAITSTIAATAVPLHKQQGTAPVARYQQTIQAILQKQLSTNALSKTTAVNKRMIANSYSADGDLLDSNHYYYSKGRGSVLSDPNSYFDSYYPTLINARQNIFSDSSVHWYTDISGTIYRDFAKKYTYDANDRVITLIEDNPTYNFLHAITYNSAGNVSMVTTSDTFGGTALIPKRNMYASFDIYNYRIADSTVNINPMMVTTRNLYTYDVAGNMTQSESAYFNGTTMVTYWRNINTYDNNKRIVTSTVSYDMGGGAGLQLAYKDSFAYTGTATQPVYNETFSWDMANSTWQAQRRYTYILNAQNLVDTYYLYNYTTQWDTLEKDVYKYDLNNLLLTTNAYRYIGKGNFSAQPYDQTTIYYEDYFPTAITTTVAAEKNIVVYPNPATDKLELQSPEGSAVAIIALNGPCVYKSTFNRSATIDIKGLQSGNYIISISDANGKLIGQKQFSKL